MELLLVYDASCTPVILGAILNAWLWRMQAKWKDSERRNPKLFPKLRLDMAIQSQPLGVHALTSQLYIL